MATMQEMAAREVLYRLPGVEAVHVERGLAYRERGGEELTFDLYRPPGAAPAPAPLVVVVGGFPDPGMRRIFGRPFRETGAVVSWCRLLAVSGIAALAFENREPREDLAVLLAYLREHGGGLGVDGGRPGLFATSGNAPAALGAAFDAAVGGVALAYPYTLDLDGSTAVADAARAWGFANGGAGRSLEDFPATVPLLLVRSGRDAFAGLNDAVDRLVQASLRRNLALECINLPDAPHAFDLEQDDAPARRAVRRILAFFGEHLSAAGAE